MKNLKEFPFEKERRITKRELAAARKAIEAQTGIARPTRKSGTGQVSGHIDPASPQSDSLGTQRS